MAQRVVLHVGLMKSGTSYVQQRLQHAKPDLRRVGFQFPGKSWKDQVIAVSEVLERKRRPPRSYVGAWDNMVAKIAGFEGASLISMEFLAAPGIPKLTKVAEAFAPAPVHVVVTARDLGRTLPAMWQESVKNGRSWTFGEYAEAVQESSGPGVQFWREQALGAVLSRWCDVVGPERVTLVTVPRPGADRELLWRRFSEATGMPVDAAPPTPQVNESLGAASVSVLREVNRALEEYAVDWADYSDIVKFGLGKAVLGHHRAQEEPIGFVVPPWLHERSLAMRRRVGGLGVRVVGDLAELAPEDVPGVDPDTVAASDQWDTARYALVQLLIRRLEKRSGPLSPLQERS